MVLISGATPPASRCLFGKHPDDCGNNPHPAVPPANYPAGVWDITPLIPPPAVEDVVVPLCNNWCLSTGYYVGATTHMGIDGDHGRCVTRCAMNDGARPHQIKKWGLPSLVGPDRAAHKHPSHHKHPAVHPHHNAPAHHMHPAHHK
jgi:hypothetical protein